MSKQRDYLTCDNRPGHPRVAPEICQICPKSRRCLAWREYRQPALVILPMPRQRPGKPSTLAAGKRASAPAGDTGQADLPFTPF